MARRRAELASESLFSGVPKSIDLSALSSPAELIDALTEKDGRTCMARPTVSEDSEDGSNSSEDDT